MLTQAGVDWKVVNSSGQNLLHVVAAVKNTTSYADRSGKRFTALVGFGLDSGMEDSAQRTPVDITAELGNNEVLELFRDK